MPDALDVIAVLVATVGAAASLYFSTIARRAEMKTREISLASWKQQYLGELRGWADECCNALSDSVHLCELDPRRTEQPSFFDRRHRLRSTLSSLIDRGRWFFPNAGSTDYGRHRQTAFLGLRDPILDRLVAAYRLLGKLDYVGSDDNAQHRENLVEIKREFVSACHNALDPLSRKTDFKSFVDEMAALRGASFN